MGDGHAMLRAMLRVIYDGDCPFCASYVRLSRLREAAGDVRLIDARQEPGEVARLRGLGISLDEGMVVEIGDQRYHGAEAMQRLALMTSRAGLFNKLNHWWFRNGSRSRLAYPLLRRGRNLTLALLGRPPIG